MTNRRKESPVAKKAPTGRKMPPAVATKATPVARVGIDAHALAAARAEEAEQLRPVREANERSARWSDVARYAQASHEAAVGKDVEVGDPGYVLVEQLRGPHDPIDSPRANLFVCRRWVRKFWIPLLGFVRPLMTKSEVAALAAPKGYRPQAKLACDAIRVQFLRLFDADDGPLQKEVIKVLFAIRQDLGVDRSMCGGFFHLLENFARQKQAETCADANRYEAELRALRRGKVAVNVVPLPLPPKIEVPSKPTHSDDFTTVNWYGVRHSFTPNQAVAVKVLWDEWEKSGGSLSQLSIAERTRSDFPGDYRLRDVFRTKKKPHPAWGSMIVPCAKGTFALAEPPRQKPT